MWNASAHPDRAAVAQDSARPPAPEQVMLASPRSDGRGAQAIRRLARGARAVTKRLVIVGATGMVGGYALRYALAQPDFGSVTAIRPTSLGLSHPKLTA